MRVYPYICIGKIENLSKTYFDHRKYTLTAQMFNQVSHDCFNIIREGGGGGLGLAKCLNDTIWLGQLPWTLIPSFNTTVHKAH